MAKSKKPAAAAAAAAAAATVTITTAADAHAAARVEALQRAAAAEVGRVNALIDAVRATVQHGPYTAEEIAANFVKGASVAVYRSNFNLGHKAAQVLGEAKAAQVIDAAAKLEGKRYDNVLDALRSVAKAGREAGGELVTGKASTAIVKAAAAAASEGAAKREAANASRKAPRKARPAEAAAEAPAGDAAALPRPRRVAQAVARASAGFGAVGEALRILARDAGELSQELEGDNRRASEMMIEAILAAAATAELIAKG